jgi:3-oxoacyl-[acyl-carrier protein] reductase
VSKPDKPLIVITGTRKGIGRYLAQHYVEKGFQVAGCSREPVDFESASYRHFCLDVCDEPQVKRMFGELRRLYGGLHALINNAGIASMNHFLLTPGKTVQRIFNTNVLGTFLFCQEAAKLMKKHHYGRIVNFSTVATPLKLEGEAAYAGSKAAVNSLTQVLAKEVAPFGITVNAVGPTPVPTDLIRGVPEAKMKRLLAQQAIGRFAEMRDVANVTDFFISPASGFVTGQVVYLGGVAA